MRIVLILTLAMLISSCGKNQKTQNSLDKPYGLQGNGATPQTFFFQGSQQKLFTIVRTNYKEDHILHYDLLLNNVNCQINSETVIDGYYMRNGSRIDFNKRNRDYYGPNILPDNKSESHLEYDFPILEGLDSLAPEHKRILVDINKVDNVCNSTAHLIYQGESYRIKKITMKLKLTFGFPSGTKWAKLDAVDKSGKSGSICLLGRCE